MYEVFSDLINKNEDIKKQYHIDPYLYSVVSRFYCYIGYPEVEQELIVNVIIDLCKSRSELISLKEKIYLGLPLDEKQL
jgi:hypothetical protein